MANKYGAIVVWSEEDGAFLATSNEFPGLSGISEDANEALAELKEAIALALEEYEAEGKEPPEPVLAPEYSGQFRLRLPKTMHKALAERAQYDGVSLNTAAVALLGECLGYARAHHEAVSGLSPIVAEVMISAQEKVLLHQVGSSSIIERARTLGAVVAQSQSGMVGH